MRARRSVVVEVAEVGAAQVGLLPAEVAVDVEAAAVALRQSSKTRKARSRSPSRTAYLPNTLSR
jgi:hypothetical protein